MKKKQDNSIHSVKCARVRNFSGRYFPAIGLNTKINEMNLRIQSECGKIRPEKLRIQKLFRQ